MILELNSIFEGFTPIQVVGKSTIYREMYVAKNSSEQYVFLTVYDMNNLPECFVDGRIPELEIASKLTNDVFPRYIEHGNYSDNDKWFRWVVTQYKSYITLTDYININSDYVRDERELLHQFYDLLIAMQELPDIINYECHNNISTDNIIVTSDSCGKIKFRLLGMDCISDSCNGIATFDTSVPSLIFRAPETFIGHYNVKTDIFSLGIVLAFILQRRQPWDFSSDIDIQVPMLVKHMLENKPILDLSEPLKSIVENAIAYKPSKRYKSLGDFCNALSKYLHLDNKSKFESYDSYFSRITTINNEMERENYDDQSQMLPPQPKANVKIERVVGNGFNDVAGMDELKGKLTRNFIDIVQNHDLAQQFHIKPPNGILLWGPPGTGKSFISRKLAEQCGMLFCMVKPSDLGNIYIHGSQKMIADLFVRSEELAAKNNCGVILVFDEFDSLVPKRDTKNYNNQENEVAEFLTRLNDCAEKNVYVIATTNRIDAIDSAVLRHGRIDEIIYVGMPDDDARKELLELELNKRPHENIDIYHIVELTQGFTAGDISYIVKECARCSFEESLKSKGVVKISQEILERIIAKSRPSISSNELREYELINQSYSNRSKNLRPRVGFI